MAADQLAIDEYIVITSDPTTGEILWTSLEESFDPQELAPNQTVYTSTTSGETALVADGTLPAGVLPKSPASHEAAAAARQKHWSQADLKEQHAKSRRIEAYLVIAGYSAHTVRTAFGEWAVWVENAVPEDVFLHCQRNTDDWALLYQHPADLPGELSRWGDVVLGASSEIAIIKAFAREIQAW
ncbi:hypothetical protein [Streptomyces sp. B6B3]|uniref:hypothetical protein n=1 Tax=Streptomyces sp. B6B3 TaxID=3153570 RepID=UPI00325C5D83